MADPVNRTNHLSISLDIQSEDTYELLTQNYSFRRRFYFKYAHRGVNGAARTPGSGKAYFCHTAWQINTRLRGAVLRC